MTSLIYNTGTVTVTNGSATVTGNLTGWAVALVTGGLLSVGGVTVPILSVESDTSLTLAYGWPDTSGAGKAYAIARQPSEATARAATWTVDRLARLAQTPWGVGVIPDGRGTLAERDAVTPLPNDDYCWLRVEVDEPAELYFRDGGVWLGPFALKGDQGSAGVGEGGYGLPAGGATGQVPTKSSGADGDVGWETLDAAPRVPIGGASVSDPDMDAYLTAGWQGRVEFSTTSIAHAPPETGIFYVLVLWTNGTRLTQILFPYSGVSGKHIWIRNISGASWGGWRYLPYSDETATSSQGTKADSALQPAAIGSTVQAYDALLTAIAALTTADGKFMAFTGVDTPALRDIVGTVSQSGGVPTGAIIEYGTNANGSYIKLADGTAICWNNGISAGATNTASGSLFSTPSATNATFPLTFSSVGVVSTNTVFANRWPGGASSLTNTGFGVVLYSTTTSATNVTFGYVAIGRWF